MFSAYGESNSCDMWKTTVQWAWSLACQWRLKHSDLGAQSVPGKIKVSKCVDNLLYFTIQLYIHPDHTSSLQVNNISTYSLLLPTDISRIINQVSSKSYENDPYAYLVYCTYFGTLKKNEQPCYNSLEVSNFIPN